MYLVRLMNRALEILKVVSEIEPNGVSFLPVVFRRRPEVSNKSVYQDIMPWGTLVSTNLERGVQRNVLPTALPRHVLDGCCSELHNGHFGSTSSQLLRCCGGNWDGWH